MNAWRRHLALVLAAAAAAAAGVGLAVELSGGAREGVRLAFAALAAPGAAACLLAAARPDAGPRERRLLAALGVTLAACVMGVLVR